MTIAVSIIIPVYKEEALIEQCCEHLLNLRGSYEIIVVDGSPQKETISSIHHPKIKTLASKPGRGVQMNCGAKEAKGEILLFLHVDTQLPPNALSLIPSYLDQHKHCVGGAFDLRFDTTEWGYSLFGWLSSLRSRLTRVPYGDQAQFFRREIFDSLGGFPNFPILEDVAIMDTIKKRGWPIHIFKEPVLSSPRRWQKEGRVYGVLRNWWLLYQYHRGVSPHQLRHLYPVQK